MVPWKRIAPRLLAGPRGQAAVEFAFVLPLVALLLLGIVDGTQAFRAATITRAAASEAARYYIQNPTASDADIQRHVRDTVAPDGDSRLRFRFQDVTGSSVPASINYKMRVQGESGGWAVRNAKTTYRTRRITVSLDYGGMLSSLAPGFKANAQASAEGTAAVEGVAR